MKNSLKYTLVAVIVLSFMVACTAKKGAKASKDNVKVEMTTVEAVDTLPKPPSQGTVKLRTALGELRNMEGLDGCKWMIALDDGTKIQPTNLAAFNIPLVDGKAVMVAYEELPGVMSTCMAGKVVKITTISVR